MTPDERDRLARLETQMSDTREDIKEIKKILTELRDAFNMGKGGAKTIAKLGGLMVLFIMGLGWLWDRFGWAGRH